MGPAAGRGVREGLPPDVRRVPRPRRGSLPRRVEQPLRAPGRGSACPSRRRPASAASAPLRPLLAGVAIAVAVAGAAAWKLGSDGKAVHTQTTATGATAAPAPVRKPPAAAPPAAPVYAVFRAARGSCWLLVRSSGPAGPVLYERTLAQGSTLRLPVGRALWVRIGAPWNLDLSVAGSAVTATARPRRPTCSSRRAESPPPRPRPLRPRPRARRSTAPRACSTTATPA